MFARITGVGGFLPGQAVTNNDLALRGIETNDEWIVSRTGIKARHLAEPGQTSSELAHEASLRALAAAGIEASELDLIIVATSTPDFVFPSTACLLQSKLGNGGAVAFDVQAVCSGFVYALTIAEKFLRSGSHKKALVWGLRCFREFSTGMTGELAFCLATGPVRWCSKHPRKQAFLPRHYTQMVRITEFYRYLAMSAVAR